MLFEGSEPASSSGDSLEPKAQRKAPTGTITGAAMELGWQTPQELLDLPRAYWGGEIPFDAATVRENPTRAARFLTPEEDGLRSEWALEEDGSPTPTWINPPYGRELRDWLERVAAEAARGRTVIALLPAARWEQLYFQRALYSANAVTWIRKRVRFINPKTGDRVSGNPYANMFLGWNVELARWATTIGRAGMSQALLPLAPSPARLEARGAIP